MINKVLTNPKGGQRWVVADIHGCFKTFRAIVEKRMVLTKQDQLFLLGDYINRGKDSAKVIEYILHLIEQRYQVFPLRGNHEQKLLNAWQEYSRLKYKADTIAFSSRLTGAFDLLDEKGELLEKYVQFLEYLPYYYELDRFYLVHGGFNFNAQNPFTDYESMLLIKKFHQNPTSKIIIHGHQIKRLEEIRWKVERRRTIIPLDNGCYKRLSFRNVLRNALLRRKIGNLCGLNLDTFELIVQKNID
ncbi:metallophosphoesterase family protein [Rhodocytophaga aerolata]|uniref:Metallophosphoesterase family protein n=1 Tax=Rhodocytophaga aerolata TaxID=455078 RepID=A0ABT8R2I9_9BACT|nr:metallophosphoesterase family protein [Rhodocytophaga aerolata]MDO1446324.1 metallophosphoesterase family protein [Rhodocytophaga aerolata]